MSFFLKRSIKSANSGWFVAHHVIRPARGLPFSVSKSFQTSSRQHNQQSRIRIGSTAPNFKGYSKVYGHIHFHEWAGNSWTVLFSSPIGVDHVGATELNEFSKLAEEFKKRQTKLIGVLIDPLGEHVKKDKNFERFKKGEGFDSFDFPVIEDKNHIVSSLYDMAAESNVSSPQPSNPKEKFASITRSVFIIDPHKKVRLRSTYPVSVGRNLNEILRAIDALQTFDKTSLATPIDWVPGDNAIVPLSMKTAEAEQKYGTVETLKPYLRFTKVPEYVPGESGARLDLRSDNEVPQQSLLTLSNLLRK